MRNGTRVPQFLEQLAGCRLELLDIGGRHLRFPIPQTRSDGLPGRFPARLRLSSYSALMKPKHQVVVPHSEKRAELCAFLKGIGGEGLVADLIIQLGSECLSGLPTRPHVQLPPQRRGGDWVFRPGIENSGLRMFQRPVRHGQAHIPTVPNQMNESRPGPKGVQRLYPAQITRSLISNQTFTLSFAV